MFEEKFFIRRKKNDEKLINYGFTKKADRYQYITSVMNGQFLLYVFVDNNGAVSTKMIDCLENEEYSLYKVPSSVGSFVGMVRTECEAILTDISEKCYEENIFHGEQTLAVINYVREKYGDEMEYLWERFPDNAIWRRKDNRKWYGAILTVSKKKLGLASNEIAEIIDLRLQPEQVAQTIDNVKYFPGWHMNKKHWYTILLNNSVSTEEICERIDISYALAVK